MRAWIITVVADKLEPGSLLRVSTDGPGVWESRTITSQPADSEGLARVRLRPGAVPRAVEVVEPGE